MQCNEKGLSQEIGEMLRTCRIKQGYSRSELSKMLKVSIQQLQKYETGINRMSINRFVAFCSGLKIKPVHIGELILNLSKSQE